jgi:hypothetical protein
MMMKFVGDKMSIEAQSRDGKLWDATLFDRGHTTQYAGATEALIMQLAAKNHMRIEKRT